MTTNRKLRDPDALRASPQVQVPEVVESLADVWAHVKPFHSAQSAAYTTKANAAHETVETTGTGTFTVSLSDDHVNTDRVTVVWNGSGDVTIDTEGTEKIMGKDTISMFSRYHSMTLYKQTNWFIEHEWKDSGLIDDFGKAIVDENGEIIGIYE